MSTKKRYLIIGSALFIGICATVASLFRLLDPDEHDISSVRAAYRAEFGSEPSPDISDIHYRAASGGDMCWFRFRANAGSVSALIKRFEPTDVQEYDRIRHLRGIPTWSDPPQTSLHYYRAFDWTAEADASVAALAHDPATGIVYFARYITD